MSQEQPKAPETGRQQAPIQLSQQTMSLLVNWILHSYRFEMQEELRREGPAMGLIKILGESIVGWFGKVPKWKHCYERLKSALPEWQLAAAMTELHYLEIDWNSFVGPISVFSESPTHDPGWRFAHKIQTLKRSCKSRIERYESGLIQDGQSGSSLGWYKDYKVSPMALAIWKAFVTALDRLEEMRLAQPGAKPWAE